MENLPDASMEHLDHQRWLMNRGLINDLHKDTLYIFGYISHVDVKAVHVAIQPEQNLVHYNIYVPKALIKKMQKFVQLKNSASMFGLWRFKRMLKAEGNLDLGFMLDRFVKDYCGPKWQASVDIRDFAGYEDHLEKEKAESETAASTEDNQPLDQ